MVPVLLLFLQLLGCMPLLGTSSPLTAAVDKGLDDFYPIVNGLPTGFVFGTASAAYQVSPVRGATKIDALVLACSLFSDFGRAGELAKLRHFRALPQTPDPRRQEV